MFIPYIRGNFTSPAHLSIWWFSSHYLLRQAPTRAFPLRIMLKREPTTHSSLDSVPMNFVPIPVAPRGSASASSSMEDFDAHPRMQLESKPQPVIKSEPMREKIKIKSEPTNETFEIVTVHRRRSAKREVVGTHRFQHAFI